MPYLCIHRLVIKKITMRSRTRRMRAKISMMVIVLVMNISNQRPDIVLEDPLIIKLPQVHIYFQQCLPNLMFMIMITLDDMIIHLKCSRKVEVVATSPQSGQDWCVVERQVAHHVELVGFLLFFPFQHHHHFYPHLHCGFQTVYCNLVQSVFLNCFKSHFCQIY